MLRWYASQRRRLPWRENPHPYAVWVAEVMAQQTRLETMLPYYRRWMKRFPSIRSLANSKEQEVLAAWEGLGYYSRARNLRKAAQVVMQHYKGRLPGDLDSLLRLPGVGRYTAGAIASMSFGRDEPAVDGNAIRVLARVFDVKSPVGSNKAAKHFWALAAEHLPPGRAADYNQALMDLGASLCKARQPECAACPLKGYCRAFALGIQEKRPVRVRPVTTPVRYFAAAVIRQNKKVLVFQRSAKGLLGGMWEFPNVALRNNRSAKSRLSLDLRHKWAIHFQRERELGQYRHAYSHFTAHLQVFGIALIGRRPKIPAKTIHRWVSIDKLHELPMGKLDRQIALSLRDNLK